MMLKLCLHVKRISHQIFYKSVSCIIDLLVIN